ncbi:MAG: hypothetical protein AABO57_12305 [Acidobacteriota bacterium]
MAGCHVAAGCRADRTVFEARLLTVLQKLAVPADEAPELGGVGGKAACIFARTRLGFVRDDGQLVNVQGLFGVFTNLTSSDVSILGRDVTNNFDVIYSFPHREVMLLAPPHGYQILSPA